MQGCIEIGARSFYLAGCFINVIKHGQALWRRIIADLHSREKGERKKGRMVGREVCGGEGEAVCRGKR